MVRRRAHVAAPLLKLGASSARRRRLPARRALHAARHAGFSRRLRGAVLAVRGAPSAANPAWLLYLKHLSPSRALRRCRWRWREADLLRRDPRARSPRGRFHAGLFLRVLVATRSCSGATRCRCCRCCACSSSVAAFAALDAVCAVPSAGRARFGAAAHRRRDRAVLFGRGGGDGGLARPHRRADTRAIAAEWLKRTRRKARAWRSRTADRRTSTPPGSASPATSC